MKLPKSLILLSVIIFFVSNNFLFAQNEFGLGVLLDPALYANAPNKAPLMRGDYNNLPKAYSLKKYCPTPKSQGSFGTCAGWSTAYAGHTIITAINRNIPDSTIDENTFSPSFVYNQIRASNDCKGGTSLLDALNVLRDQGGVKFTEFGYDCEREVKSEDIEQASDYRIIEYREIANSMDGNQALFTKKSLSENKPVILAMDCPPSFQNCGDVWTPDSTEYKYWGRGHGIAVVAYDDNKSGGAFQLMNSWGTDWGNEGFAWIRYSDYEYFGLIAFELIDLPKSNYQKPDLSGKLLFRESNSEVMKMNFNGEYFTTKQTYYSGTLFELFVSNEQPAYVYAFSSDLTYKVNKIFPFDDRMVAYLPYSQNNVAIPSEDSYNMLDDVKGKSYYCFLYSKNKIAIDERLKEIEKSTGTFWQRINNTFGDELIKSDKISFTNDEDIRFTAFSSASTIIPILIEINHE